MPSSLRRRRGAVASAAEAAPAHHEPYAPYAHYVYPEHLRAALADLPAAPGVYRFYGAREDWPLYIGKSINIRSRVLAHFRTVAEATLLRQTQSIRYQRTAGEVGALLLESRLIKAEQPLHNQKLRRSRLLCAWQIGAGAAPVLVNARATDFAADHGARPLYGLFQSRRAAQEWLRTLVDAHGLCPNLVGLSSTVAGRPCFGFQIKQCRGACCGQESRAEHDARLLAAAASWQVRAWPYPGAVALIERDGPHQEFHVLRNWCHLGTVATEPEARALQQVAAYFDVDAYKILVRPVLAALTGAPDAPAVCVFEPA